MSGMLDRMPRYVRPSAEEQLEAAIDALGNRVRVAIIGHLRASGGASRAEIERAIGVAKSTVNFHLAALLELGVLSATPPLDESARGQVIDYRVDEKRLRELIDVLLASLGEASKS